MCISVPIPWPTYSRTIPYRPLARALVSTACEMSLSRFPGRAWARPAHSARSQARSSSASSSLIGPTPTVRAASPCQPSRIAPQSIEIRSPAASRASALGMPCTIWSLTEVQIVAGYPWYPLNEGTAPAARISRSAITSRSSVVMPGSTAAVSTSSVCDTTRPASRIAAIWPGVLIWIGCSRLVRMAPPDSLIHVTVARSLRGAGGHPRPAGWRPAAGGAETGWANLGQPPVAIGERSADEAPQRAQRPVGDLLYRPGGVDAEQYALIRVECVQRLGLLLIHIQPMPDRLLPVVVALEQIAAAVVTVLAARRRVEQHVPYVPALAAGPPPREPPDHLVVVHHELEHQVQPGVPLGQHLLQRLGLGHVPREPVEQEAALRVVLLQPVGNHRDRDLVGHQVAAVHEGLGRAAEFGAGAHVVPEDLTCRDRRDRQVGGYELGLRPLARTGGPDEDDSHYLRKPS